MSKINKEHFKSIMLGILVILSIYLYYKVYFQSPIGEYLKSFEERLNNTDEEDIIKNAQIILVKPDEVFLNISKNISVAILSNQKEYEKLMTSFIDALKEGILKNDYQLQKSVVNLDQFKTGPTFMLNYSYFVDFKTLIYELTKKRIGLNWGSFTFDKVFIKETTRTEVYFYNSASKKGIVLLLKKKNFNDIASYVMDRGKLIYSWSDSLGFTKIVEENTLIPIELSNIEFSEIKQRDNEQKKEAIIRRIFPDTILTRKNILKNGDIIITDERRWLLLKSDGEYIFRFTNDTFADTFESIKDAISFYLKVFYSNEDVRICRIEKENSQIKICLINRIDGIDVLPENSDYSSYIQINGSKLKEIRGNISEIISIRNARIKVDGMMAIDTIKERKGDIFIKGISLRYVLKNGASSYPYWQVITDSGTVYIETIK